MVWYRHNKPGRFLNQCRWNGLGYGLRFRADQSEPDRRPGHLRRVARVHGRHQRRQPTSPALGLYGTHRNEGRRHVLAWFGRLPDRLVLVADLGNLDGRRFRQRVLRHRHRGLQAMTTERQGMRGDKRADGHLTNATEPTSARCSPRLWSASTAGTRLGRRQRPPRCHLSTQIGSNTASAEGASPEGGGHTTTRG